MALYFIAGRLIRARNGSHAQELIGITDIEPIRVTEDGAHGVLAFEEPSSPAPKKRRRQKREIETTSLEDRGVRRYKDLETGEERTEPRD